MVIRDAVLVSAIVGCSIGLAVPVSAAGAGQARPAHPVDLSKYPAAVRETIERETRNATLKSVSRETEKGRTQYEVETMVAGRSRDLLVSPAGKVVEVEVETPLAEAPAAVRDALASHGKVLKVESVQRDGRTTYECRVQAANGRRSSIALDADGKPTKG